MSRAILNWTLPTERENGAPMDVAEIAHTEIEVSADGGANYSSPVIIPVPTTTFEVADLVAGNYSFRGVVVDIDGRRSQPAVADGTVLAPPNAINLTVDIVEN